MIQNVYLDVDTCKVITQSDLNPFKIKDALFFDSEGFHLLHQDRVKSVFRLIFVKVKRQIGFMVIGVTPDEMIRVPYSSPFSNVYFEDDTSLMEKQSCIKALCKYSDALGMDILWALPPVIYDALVNEHLAILLECGFKLEYSHVNSYFDLDDFLNRGSFIEDRAYSYRKNIKRAEKSNLVFLSGGSDLLSRCYRVIEKNREEKGYPLAMKLDQIEKIAEIGDVEVFIISDLDDDIAAALVFKVNDKSVQVVYWGHLDAHSSKRPMEFLSLELIQHFKKKSFEYVDVGPSTVNNSISYGLWQFKKNLGCKTTLKHVLKYEASEAIE